LKLYEKGKILQFDTCHAEYAWNINGAWREETKFEIFLNMHELLAVEREETKFEIVLNMHELFTAVLEETKGPGGSMS